MSKDPGRYEINSAKRHGQNSCSIAHTAWFLHQTEARKKYYANEHCNQPNLRFASIVKGDAFSGQWPRAMPTHDPLRLAIPFQGTGPSLGGEGAREKEWKATKVNSHRNMDAVPTASFPACDCQIWPAGLDRFWYCWCWAWNRWRLECPAFYWLETLSEERIYCDTDLEYAGIRMMIFPWSSWHACFGVLGKCSWGWLVRSMSSTLHHHAFNKWQHFCQETQIRKPWILGRRVSIVSDFLQVEWCVQEDCTAAVWGVQASLMTLKSPWCLCSIQGKYDSMIIILWAFCFDWTSKWINEVFCASISIYSTEHMMLWLTNCACAVHFWHQ